MTIEYFKSLWHDDRRLRRHLLLIDFGLIGFWAYSVAYVRGHFAEKGSDGFEILAAIPMTLIALFLSLPALLLLISNRTLRIGAWVTLAAIVMNVCLANVVFWHSGLGREWRCATFWTLCF